MGSDPGLALAHRLIEAGIPVVIVRPGDKPAQGWESATPDVRTLKGYRPGTDALAMVGGWGIDIVDVDTKPGVRGSVDNLPPFEFYGITGTPSGGRHYLIPSTGLGKISPLRTDDGLVGDYVGGRDDGSGRMLAFLPGSTRSKYPGLDYVEVDEWDIDGCLAAEPEPELVAVLRKAGGHDVEVPRYVDDSEERAEGTGVHPYAVAAINGELAKLDECELLGWEGPPWDSTSYKVACNLIEVANSRWAGYSLEDAHQEFLDHAPTDDSFGAVQHEAKWASALNRVGDGGRRPPSTDAPRPDAPSAIFDATPRLAHIRQAAHSRMVGSGALLCFVLGRVLASAPPAIVLPPTIGSPASLNLAFALVGKSGDGKSVTSSVSSELLGIDQAQQETGIGSGEGLMEAFLEPYMVPDIADASKMVKAKRLVDPPVRILEIDEIGQLGAVGKRDGSSLMPVLRTALTGGALKSSNATADRRRNIEKASYRLVAFCGVQPELSDVLLHDAVGGTPQRFVWVSVSDKTIERDRPAWPGPLGWSPWQLELLEGGHTISYPEHVRETILETRYTQVKEGLDPLAGHQLLTRLKVAAALAFLHDEIDITDQWWELAGLIIDWSIQEQQRCAATLAHSVADRDVSKGRSEARVEAAREDAAVDRVKDTVLRKLGDGKEHQWGKLRDSLRSNVREHFGEAVSALVADSLVKVTSTKTAGGQTARTLVLKP